MAQKLTWSEIKDSNKFIIQYMIPLVAELIKYYKNYPKEFWMATQPWVPERKRLMELKDGVRKLWRMRPIFDHEVEKRKRYDNI